MPRLVLGIALALAASLLLPMVAGDSKPASDLATAYNTQRKVARDAAGGIYVAYVQPGSVPRVLVAYSQNNGRTWKDLQPPTTSGHPSDRASLAVDSRGTLHLAWTETTGEGYRQVFYASYRCGAWSAPFQLSFTRGYSGFPSLAVDSRDWVHVVWYGFDGEAYQVHYRFSDGNHWSNLLPITSGQLDALNPALAIGPDNALHVAYYRLNGADTAVYYLASHPDWSTPEILSNRQNPSSDPTLAVDSIGVVHVAWSAIEGNRSAIIYRNLTGGAWSPPVELSSPGASAHHPSLAIVPAHNISVLWDQDDGQIYVARWDGQWRAPEALTHGGKNTYPTTRWATFGDGPRSALDYAWTQEADGKVQLAFATTGSAPMGLQGPCPSTFPVAYVLLGTVAVAVGSASAVLLVRRGRRP